MYTFDVNGLGVDLVAEAAKAMLRLRSSYSFIPHLVFLFLLFISSEGCDVLNEASASHL